MFFDLNF